MRRIAPGQPALIAGFTLAYALTMHLSLLFEVRAGSVAVFWPAAGIAAAAIIVVARRDRGWMLVALIVANAGANLADGAGLRVALGLAAANSTETVAFLVAWVALGARRDLRDLTSWAAFCVSAVIATFVGASLGATTVALGRNADFMTAGMAWWASDGVGMLIVAPMLIGLSRSARGRRPTPRRIAEGAAVVAVLALILGVSRTDAARLAFIILTVPPLVWTAMRLGRATTAWITGCLAIAATTISLPVDAPLSQLDPGTALVTRQLLLAAVVLTILTLAVASDQARCARNDLLELERSFRRNFDDALLGMLFLEFDVETGTTVVTRANDAARRLLATDQSPGQTWQGLLPPDEQTRIDAVMRAVSTGDEASWRGEIEHIAGGLPAWLDVSIARIADGDHEAPVSLTAQIADVTPRKLAEERLLQIAMHDELTGLPNRALLTDRLQHELSTAERRNTSVGILFLDLDEFKTINDAAGHLAGDEVLRSVAQRLTEVIRPGDTVSRLGGDEFVVLCPDLHEHREARRVADRVLDALSHPVEVGLSSYSVTASIGIALADAETENTAESILRQADAAMYAAKRKGKGRAEVFEQEMQVRAARRAGLAPEIRRALDNDEFVLHFQPIVDLATSQPLGVEALARWQHPDRGLLPPGEWLDVAEQTDLIVRLGRWVLREACRWGSMWQETLGESAPIVHVNVSARHLSNATFMHDVRQALEESGCSPRRLVLELTETHLLTVSSAVRRDLERLRTLGVRLAADDYGTGYSALSHVTELEVDILKVDKSFILAMTTCRRSHAVVQAVIGLGNSLGLEVVAEGVETPEVAAELVRLGCLSGQGFLWSAARPPTEVAALLHGRRALSGSGHQRGVQESRQV